MKNLEKILLAGALAAGIGSSSLVYGEKGVLHSDFGQTHEVSDVDYAARERYYQNFGKSEITRSYYDIENEYKRLKRSKDIDRQEVVLFDYYNFTEDRRLKDLSNYVRGEEAEYETRYLQRARDNLLFFREENPNDVRNPARLALYNYLLGDDSLARSFFRELERSESLQQMSFDTLFADTVELGDFMEMYAALDKFERAEFIAEEYVGIIAYDPKDINNLIKHFNAEAYMFIAEKERFAKTKHDSVRRHSVEHFSNLSRILDDLHKFYPQYSLIKDVDEAFKLAEEKVRTTLR